MFQSFIYPHILYATPLLLNSSNTTILNLERTYKKAIKILFRLPFDYPSTLLPHKTNIPNLSSLIHHHNLIYAHLIYHMKSPSMIYKYFSRSVRKNILLHAHSDNKSLHNNIAQTWNSLTMEIKSISNKHHFKKTVQKLFY